MAARRGGRDHPGWGVLTGEDGLLDVAGPGAGLSVGRMPEVKTIQTRPGII
jgi:hypothetical protein